ncbi:hypothetical protein ACX80O_03885 [Arthrobacter sp. Hz1]
MNKTLAPLAMAALLPTGCAAPAADSSPLPEPTEEIDEAYQLVEAGEAPTETAAPAPVTTAAPWTSNTWAQPAQ